MKRYQVNGMSCAACSAAVERAVRKVPGVTECAVSLLTNSMTVEGNATAEEICAAVGKAGYEAIPEGKAATKNVRPAAGGNAATATPNPDGNEASVSQTTCACENGVANGVATEPDPLADRETPKLKKRLALSLVGLLVLMYIGMGHDMFGFPIPGFLEDDKLRGGLQMLLALFVMGVNVAFFVKGVKGLLHLAPNMDTLVAMGAFTAWAYSVVLLFTSDSTEWYFESAAMILTLITVGKMLEARAKGKTTDALRSLMKLAPKVATVRRDGEERVIPADQVVVGDIFVVRPGESIPVDGEVTEGISGVNEAALTGESMPVTKTVSDTVHAATINGNGFLVCRATAVGEDTSYAAILRLVADSAATKAPIAKMADRVAAFFVPAVILIALVTEIIRLLLGQPVGEALASGISVLVISCPCSLGLATPVAVMVGSGVGARNGILYKSAEALEQAGRVQTVLLDKTGTVTTGVPQVTDVFAADVAAGTSEGVSEAAAETSAAPKAQEVLRIASALEIRSGHLLAEAILQAATKRGITVPDGVEDFLEVPGKGIRGTLDGAAIRVGNRAFVEEVCDGGIPEATLSSAAAASEAGKTPVYVASGDRCLGCIMIADGLKEDSIHAVSRLREMGIRAVLLTGDNEKTAQAIGKQLGADEIFAQQLPGDKAEAVSHFPHCAMVGDGINDAPALVKADLGMAIGAGTDVAIDAADIVLSGSSLTEAVEAIRLGRFTLRIIRQNLFWAFFYNVLCIPLAAGALTGLTGLTMNPMVAAAAMSLSSFCVVSNALRINLFRKEKSITKTEENAMKTVTMEISGMMCEHCEARVRRALLSVPGVSEAIVSHTENKAVVTCSAEVSAEALSKAVTEQDYKVEQIY